MKHKQLAKDVTKKFNKLSSFASSVSKSYEEEDIHQFRVTFKKLRASLRMYAGKMRGTHLPKNIKDIYTSAGTIRDLQLHKKAILSFFEAHNEIPSNYLKHIDEEIAASKSGFYKPFEQFSKSRTRKTILRYLPEHLSLRKIKKWREKHLHAIKELSRVLPTNEVLHQIRKLIKDLDYTSKYIGDANQYTKLTDILGSYVDLFVQLGLLNDQTKSATDGEMQLLMRIEKRWRTDKLVLKHQITKALARFR